MVTRAFSFARAVTERYLVRSVATAHSVTSPPIAAMAIVRPFGAVGRGEFDVAADLPDVAAVDLAPAVDWASAVDFAVAVDLAVALGWPGTADFAGDLVAVPIRFRSPGFFFLAFGLGGRSSANKLPTNMAPPNASSR